MPLRLILRLLLAGLLAGPVGGINPAPTRYGRDGITPLRTPAPGPALDPRSLFLVPSAHADGPGDWPMFRHDPAQRPP